MAGKFRDLLQSAGISRTFKPAATPVDLQVQKLKIQAGFNGFGKQLYNYVAPEQLKTAIAEIRNQSKPLKRVMIRTSNPSIPWELMILDDRRTPTG